MHLSLVLHMQVDLWVHVPHYVDGIFHSQSAHVFAELPTIEDVQSGCATICEEVSLPKRKQPLGVANAMTNVSTSLCGAFAKEFRKNAETQFFETVLHEEGASR